MPDLQSELTKILNQKGFDDEKTPKETIMDTPTPAAPANSTKRRRVWNYIQANPSVTSTQVAAALGFAQSAAAAHLKHMLDMGVVERTVHNNEYFYMVSATGYPEVNRGEAIRAGRAKAAKKRTAKAARKAKTEAKVKQSLELLERVSIDAPRKSLNQMKVELGYDPNAFDPDRILAGLNVLQAKQLLAKLNQLFAV